MDQHAHPPFARAGKGQSHRHRVGTGFTSLRQARSAGGGKGQVRARHIMVPEPYVASFRTPLNEVVFEMAKRRIGSVIVQRQGKLAGILSAIDVCRILGEYLESMFPNGRRGGDSAA